MTTPAGRRESVIAKIRLGLGANDLAARRAEVAERLARPASQLVPERAKQPADERRRQLRTYLEGQSATFIEVENADDVPTAVARYLRSANLPLRVRVGDDPYLSQLAWQSEPALERRSGRAHGDDEVGLSRAAAAVASRHRLPPQVQHALHHVRGGVRRRSGGGYLLPPAPAARRCREDGDGGLPAGRLAGARRRRRARAALHDLSGSLPHPSFQ